MKEKIKSFQNNIIRLFKKYWWILAIASVILAIIGILKIVPSNSIWFILAIIFFDIFYWYFISLLLFIPQMPVMALVVYAEENSYKKWVRRFLFPIALTIGFIVGILIPCSIFGGGLGLIALYFAENATYPLVYFIIAGFSAFTIVAPSGETSLLGSFVSLFAFLMVILKTSIGLVMGGTLAWIYGIFWLILIIVGLIIIGSGILISSNFIVRRFILKNKVDTNDIAVSQINYFKGYCIFNIILILGGIAVAFLLGLFLSDVMIQSGATEIVLIIFGFITTFVYWILLYRLYKVSKLLKKERLLSMSPILILIIIIILTYTLPIVAIIPFIIIWMKCNTYLQLQKVSIK